MKSTSSLNLSAIPRHSTANCPVLPWSFEPLEYHYSAGLSPARRRPSMHKKQGFALPRRGPAGKRWAEFREIVPMAAVQAEKAMDSAENSALADGLRRLAGHPRGAAPDRGGP